MPTLPGPAKDWPSGLARLVAYLAESPYADPSELFAHLGDGKPQDLSWYANQLAPAQLLTRGSDGGIKPTSYATEWTAKGDPAFLVLILHRHVRYVGELLEQLLAGPLTIREITDLANANFRVGWRSADPVRRRVSWLTALGMIEGLHDLKHGITEAGRTVLADLQVQSADELWSPAREDDADEDLGEVGASVGGLLADLSIDQTKQDNRHHVLAYIPTGSSHSPIDSLRVLTSTAVPEVTLQDFERVCADLFNVKASSAGSALTTLRTLGLYEPTGRNRFTATPAAREWLESGNDLDLVRLLHVNLRFVGELLVHVDELKRAPALHRLAAAEYGLEAANSGSTAKIMQIMRLVGLVRETGYAQYAATSRGRRLVAQLPLAIPKSSLAKDALLADLDTRSTTDIEELAHLELELIESSTDAQNPSRLEKAVADAFDFLGLQSSHIGGPGNTDVLVDIGLGATSLGIAIVDAKSSASGIIGEKLINFQALREHKKKHSANLAAIIGPSFPDGRLQEWAAEEEVVLITAEQLVRVLQRHLVTPMSPHELVELFDARGGWERIEEFWTRRDRVNRIMSLVVQNLVREAEEDDPVLGSSLDVTSLYRSLRDEVHPKPTTEELREVLDFLSTPYLGILESGRNGYSMRESPRTSALRLRAFATILGSGTAD